MAVALRIEDLQSPIAEKLRNRGIEIIPDTGILEPEKTRSVLIVNPMPNNTQDNITANIIDLFAYEADAIIRPTFWHIDVESDKKTAIINFSDEKFEDIKKQDFDAVVSAGASVDHVDYDNIKNLDKLRNVFRWATENTGGLMTICWSSMLAFNEFHNVPKYVNEEDGQRIKIIGHFENSVVNEDSPYTAALKEISVLPLGCTGYLRDQHLYDLEKRGEISILSNTFDKKKIAHNSSVAIAIDKKSNIFFWGPHPDYRPEENNKPAYVEGEVERDRNPKKAQSGVIIKEVIGEDKFGEEYDWRQGASKIFKTFHAESHGRKQKLANNKEQLQSVTSNEPLPNLIHA